jgi:hypothetical protein
MVYTILAAAGVVPYVVKVNNNFHNNGNHMGNMNFRASSDKCQTLLSQWKVYERKRVDRLKQAWTVFTDHGKGDVQGAIQVHQALWRHFKENSRGTNRGTNFEAEHHSTEKDKDKDTYTYPDTDTNGIDGHDTIDVENLDDVQDDNDDFFEKSM